MVGASAEESQVWYTQIQQRQRRSISFNINVNKAIIQVLINKFHISIKEWSLETIVNFNPSLCIHLPFALSLHHLHDAQIVKLLLSYANSSVIKVLIIRSSETWWPWNGLIMFGNRKKSLNGTQWVWWMGHNFILPLLGKSDSTLNFILHVTLPQSSPSALFVTHHIMCHVDKGLQSLFAISHNELSFESGVLL